MLKATFADLSAQAGTTWGKGRQHTLKMMKKIVR